MFYVVVTIKHYRKDSYFGAVNIYFKMNFGPFYIIQAPLYGGSPYVTTVNIKKKIGSPITIKHYKSNRFMVVYILRYSLKISYFFKLFKYFSFIYNADMNFFNMLRFSNL